MVAGPIVDFVLSLAPPAVAGPVLDHALSFVGTAAGPVADFVLSLGAGVAGPIADFVTGAASRAAGPIAEFVVDLDSPTAGPVLDHILAFSPIFAGPIFDYFLSLTFQRFAGPVSDFERTEIPLIFPLDPALAVHHEFKVPNLRDPDCVGTGHDGPGGSPGTCGREGAPT
mgnify:CR=1 FL=1